MSKDESVPSRVERIVDEILEDYEDQDLLDFEERDFASTEDIELSEVPEVSSDNEKDDAENDECDAEDLANLVHHFDHAYKVVKYILLTRDRCVFGAIRKADESKVVIVLALDKHLRQMLDGVPREVQLMKRVAGSEFVVELLGWEKLNEDVYALLLPFYHNCEIVASTFDSHFMIARFMEGLLRGLKHLKDCGVAHRDIAPYNVMWNPVTLEVKIIDFDLACRTRSNGYRNFCGRDTYSAPEKLNGHYYDNADVYSAGVMFWMMLTQHKHSPERKQLDNWIKKARKKYRHKVEIDLLCKMLAFHPKDRISIEDALAHEFFRQNEVCRSETTAAVLAELEREFESESESEDEKDEDVGEIQMVGSDVVKAFTAFMTAVSVVDVKGDSADKEPKIEEIKEAKIEEPKIEEIKEAKIEKVKESKSVKAKESKSVKAKEPARDSTDSRSGTVSRGCAHHARELTELVLD